MRFLKSSLLGQLTFGFVLGAIGLLAFQPGYVMRAVSAVTVHHHHA